MDVKQEGNALLQACAHIWSVRAVGENWLCCAQWTSTKWSGSMAPTLTWMCSRWHLRAPSAEPVVSLTLSLTCGSCCHKPMPLSAWLETITKRLYQMMAWKTSLGLSLYADGNTIDRKLPRQRMRVLVMPVSPGHYGLLLDVSAPGETSACPLCFVRLSVFHCLNGEKKRPGEWMSASELRNNPCRVVMGLVIE